MVQYREGANAPRTSAIHLREYWAIPKTNPARASYELQKLHPSLHAAQPKLFTRPSHLHEHYPRRKRANLEARLPKQFYRTARGQLLYETCSAAELRRFSAARKLRVAERKGRAFARASRAMLIQELEDADEAAGFPRFADLPPEIRKMVYREYCAALQVVDVPTQPPLTRVSRLLRKEALPMFYDVCQFRIELFDDIWEPEGEEEPPARGERVDFRVPSVGKLLDFGPAEFLERIRRVEVEGRTWVPRLGRYVTWVVELKGKTERQVLWATLRPCFEPPLDLPAPLDEYEASNLWLQMARRVRAFRRMLRQTSKGRNGLFLRPASGNHLRKLFSSLK